MITFIFTILFITNVKLYAIIYKRIEIKHLVYADWGC